MVRPLVTKAEVFEEELVSQFRCNGSDGYLAWLDDVLDAPTNRLKPSSRLSPPQRITDNRIIDIKHESLNCGYVDSS